MSRPKVIIVDPADDGSSPLVIKMFVIDANMSSARALTDSSVSVMCKWNVDSDWAVVDYVDTHISNDLAGIGIMSDMGLEAAHIENTLEMAGLGKIPLVRVTHTIRHKEIADDPLKAVAYEVWTKLIAVAE